MAIDKGQVACRVLLVTESSTPLTSIEDKVAQKAATAFLHVDTGVVAVGCLWKVEDNVLYRGRLSRWPMNTPGCARNGGGVNDQVANLTKEDVGWHVGRTVGSPWV